MTTKEISKYEISFSKDFRDYLKSEYGENVFEDLQDYQINEKSIFFTAGDKNGRETALLNLPTCESCEYWEVAPVVSIGLCVHPILDTKHFLKKEYGCIYHSKIEQLRKDNDNS